MIYHQWQDVVTFLQQGFEENRHEQVLDILLTPDEKETLTTRLNIFDALLQGKISQRQISQDLGVGIATITRGSHEVKRLSEEEKHQLMALLFRLEK